MYEMLRLLVLLGLVDSVHLVTTLCSFSLPTLSRQFRDTTYHHTLPYTLPLAQVITGHYCRVVLYSIVSVLYFIVLAADVPGDVGLHDDIPHGGEVPVSRPSSLHYQEQVQL